MLTVAVIGGGPAGAACAWTLAQAGVRTLLFERDPDREKPCGGGLTDRAWQAFPELRSLDLPFNDVVDFRLVGPSGRAADIPLHTPIRVISRRILDNALRHAAWRAGASLVREPVRELKKRPGGGWQVNDHAAAIVVGAGGMNDPLARLQGLRLPRTLRGLSVGRFIPGAFAPRIVCRFFPEAYGYAWLFPRVDHASLGVELHGTTFDTRRAWELLHRFAAENLPDVDVNAGATYGWSAPTLDEAAFARHVFGGDDWLLVGDAAGLVDSTTGEGLSYALASGRLAARSILLGEAPAYGRRVRALLLPELIKSARLSPKFYRSWFLRLSLLALSRSRTCRRTAADMAGGAQSYLTLKKRVYREMPRIAGEMILGG
ncbi:MAG TPA: NAD(P)/FAD-dependent oxidoreductase [bacterium]|nr:NAD(P)/FAD-dependent oxidoreductase [bacterium]